MKAKTPQVKRDGPAGQMVSLHLTVHPSMLDSIKKMADTDGRLVGPMARVLLGEAIEQRVKWEAK